MPHEEPLPSICAVTPDELPIWLPEERGHREMIELIRDHWWMVKQFAEQYRVRSVAVIDRLTAEQRGNWPPQYLVRHRGQEYWLGEYPGTCHHPTLQASLDQSPRAIRVLVAMRGLPAGASDRASVGEYLVDLDYGPPGVKLAGGDRAPGAES
jgi:hypothetical protein